jgi:hypothetical protein
MWEQGIGAGTSAKFKAMVLGREFAELSKF